MELLPWDEVETKAHMKHRWISNPRATYGPYFDTFCRSLHPLTTHKETDDFVPTTPAREHYRTTSGDSTKEHRADNKHKWISDPQESYGLLLADFCASFDPTAPLSLMKGDFVATTKVKEEYRTTMRDFVATTKVKTWQDQRALIAATFLQGEGYDQPLRKEVYWGHQKRGDVVIPIVIDTGASISISGEKADFYEGIKDVDPKLQIHGLNHKIHVKGIGKVRWKIKDQLGQIAIVETTAYYIPDAQVRLFSPQLYFIEEQGGELVMTKDEVTLTTAHDKVRLSFPINDQNNLPMALPIPMDSGFCTFHVTTEEIYLNATEETNQNMTAPQKELLGWHQKFGHAGFRWVQSLMIPRTPRYRRHRDGDGLLRKVIATKHNSTRTCDTASLLCTACKLARANRRPDGVTRTVVRAHEMAVRRGDLRPGDCVSLDQYESSYPGRLPHTRGSEPGKTKYVGGTLGVDHASTMIFGTHQASLRAGNTIESKKKLEKWARQVAGVKIQKYHADNGIFNSLAFLEHIHAMDQEIDFSGVGAHHQNGVAERAIRTVTEWARTMLLHAMLHWPDEVDLDLWPFAMDHAIYLWNHLPNEHTGVAPVEVFTGQVLDDFDFLKSVQVFGCPCYVLDPKLQDGKKLPKWVPRSRRGQYLGISTEHSSTIGRIRNLTTGYVSPQFHVVYDPFFTTVPSAGDPELAEVDRINLDALLGLGNGHRDFNQLEDHDELGNAEPAPELGVEWLTFREQQVRQRRRERLAPLPGIRVRRRVRAPPPAGRENVRNAPANIPAAAAQPHDDPGNEPEDGDEDSDEIEMMEEDMIDDYRVEDADDDDSVPNMGHANDDEDSSSDDDDSDDEDGEEPELLGRGRRRKRPTNNTYGGKGGAGLAKAPNYDKRKVTEGAVNNAFLNGLDWGSALSAITHSNASDYDRFTAQVESEFDQCHPLALTMKANSMDTPNWHQAMNGLDSDGYWQAMELELDTLLGKDAWVEVDRDDDMNVLPSTWAFKCKRFPDGLVRKLKARFCVRGDCQIDGVDVFDTYAPVVSWTTVRLLLILSVVLGLSTKQVDYTAAFVQAELDEDEQVFVEMPKGFKKQGKVLKLKRALYGLRQSPRTWFEHLKGKLTSDSVGFEQSPNDPCLFYTKDVICVVYVDDCLFFSPSSDAIEETFDKMREAGLDFNIEEDVAGFLGVLITAKNDGTGAIELTQTGLIDRIITALRLDDANMSQTPAEYGALPKDIHGLECQEDWNYRSVLGMILYLCNTRPDIMFATSQCARYTGDPKHSHEVALKRIGRYLKGTRTRGLVLNADDGLDIELFVDADFAGMHGYEDPDDPTSTRSRTGYVICIAKCPVLWFSKLQTETALSTMHAEYIALSTAMRDLIPFKRIAEEVCRHMGLSDEKMAVIKAKTVVHEDNSGALSLAKLEPGRNTPTSKFFNVKYHWFREQIKPNNIEMRKVSSEEQLGDIFTKGLRTTLFKSMRFKLCGW
jgi:hypothetical protein